MTDDLNRQKQTPPAGAYTVAELPKGSAAIRCGKCGREERYRKEDLLAMFDPDTPLPQVLIRLANCPDWGNATDPCRASLSAPAG
jgi:hypothetical protein